jgi:hypothetical protein
MVEAAGLDPTTLITPALDSVSSGLSGVAGPALLVGAGILAVTVGWKFVRKFAK